MKLRTLVFKNTSANRKLATQLVNAQREQYKETYNTAYLPASLSKPAGKYFAIGLYLQHSLDGNDVYRLGTHLTFSNQKPKFVFLAQDLEYLLLLPTKEAQSIYIKSQASIRAQQAKK